MRCISLWQPWASLVILGLKQYETRDWFWKCDGPCLIHAAKKPFNPLHYQTEFLEQLVRDQVDLSNLPYGCILGSVEQGQCFPTIEICEQVSRREACYGNYGPGRFAKRLINPKPFVPVIPYKGMQGFFNVPDEVVREVLAA